MDNIEQDDHKTIYLYSNKVWVEGGLVDATIEIRKGMIKSIHEGRKSENAGIFVDKSDEVIMPGVVDIHVHINEPGHTDWEGFRSATEAAAHGGITHMMDMPLNSIPVTTRPKALELKWQYALPNLHVNCGFWAGATNYDEQSLKSLFKMGCPGVKVFLIHSGLSEFPNIKLPELAKVMSLAAQHDVAVLIHAELESKRIFSHKRSVSVKYETYLASRPDSLEIQAIKQIIQLVRKTRCRTHIVHLSSSKALSMIKEAKLENIPMTVETCPHYILFESENIPDGGTLWKCAPPIRSKENKEQLIGGILRGEIDFLASDHSPCLPGMKNLEVGNFFDSWGGIAGLQVLLPASWTALKPKMSLEEFIPLLTSKPAHFLRLKNYTGTLRVGDLANICIWKPEDKFMVERKMIKHKHGITPYLGEELFGLVTMTLVNGWIVYDGKSMTRFNKGLAIRN